MHFLHLQSVQPTYSVMRAITFLLLPLALASSLPSNQASVSLQKRYDRVPCRIDTQCNKEYQDQMKLAIENMKNMVEDAVEIWADNGKLPEVAALYLGIPRENQGENPYTKQAADSLRRILTLTDLYPPNTEYVVRPSLSFLCYHSTA